MSDNESKEINSFDEILGKDIVKKLLDKTGVELTEQEIKKLEKEAVGSVDFMKAMDEIELPKDNYIIFTDGDEQLLYENGEFFVISTIDSPKRRKKKTKKEATDMYLNYFIKYQLNPILDKRSNTKDKTQEKKKTRTIKPKVAAVPKKEKIESEKIKKAENIVKEEVKYNIKEKSKSVDKELEL